MRLEAKVWEANQILWFYWQRKIEYPFCKAIEVFDGLLSGQISLNDRIASVENLVERIKFGT